MRLDKFLAKHNIGSRSEVKKYVKNGRVTVNGEVEGAADRRLKEQDVVCVDGREISHQHYYYYMFHKPAGCVSACEDAIHKTVMDYFADCDTSAGLFPVGRLDKDTEGLLLVTNDGDFAHRLTSPRKHVVKKYYFRSDAPLCDDAAERMAGGLILKDGTRCRSAELILEAADMVKGDACRAAGILSISEGIYHQVKRMVAACGGHVTYLKRLSIGALTLDEGLNKGAYRELTEEEKCLAISQCAERI